MLPSSLLFCFAANSLSSCTSPAKHELWTSHLHFSFLRLFMCHFVLNHFFFSSTFIQIYFFTWKTRNEHKFIQQSRNLHEIIKKNTGHKNTQKHGLSPIITIYVKRELVVEKNKTSNMHHLANLCKYSSFRSLLHLVPILRSCINISLEKWHFPDNIRFEIMFA